MSSAIRKVPYGGGHKVSGFLLGRKERDFTGKQWCKRWERRIFKDRNCAQLDLKMGGKRKKFQQTGCRASGHGAVHRRRTYGQRLLVNTNGETTVHGLLEGFMDKRAGDKDSCGGCFGV